MNDIFRPLTKRLKKLSVDSQNTATNVLSIFVGARNMTEQRTVFAGELQKLIDQVAAVSQSWHSLEVLLAILEAKSGELNEAELIRMVEGLADAAIISEQMGEVYKLAQTDCALRMLKLEPALVRFAVIETASYEGGPEQLHRFREAIDLLEAR